VRRREFANLAAAAVAWPIAASAQKPMPVIGFLSARLQRGDGAGLTG